MVRLVMAMGYTATRNTFLAIRLLLKIVGIERTGRYNAKHWIHEREKEADRLVEFCNKASFIAKYLMSNIERIMVEKYERNHHE